MQIEIEHVDVGSKLEQLDIDARRLTGALVELVEGDKQWWLQNLELMVAQPLTSLKHHLGKLNDPTLSSWELHSVKNAEFSILDPIESLVWLVGLCNLDRILLAVLPTAFTEEVLLQWRLLSMHWLY